MSVSVSVSVSVRVTSATGDVCNDAIGAQEHATARNTETDATTTPQLHC